MDLISAINKPLNSPYKTVKLRCKAVSENAIYHRRYTLKLTHSIIASYIHGVFLFKVTFPKVIFTNLFPTPLVRNFNIYRVFQNN